MRSAIGFALLALVVSLGAASTAHAQASSCSDFPNGVVDGNVVPTAPNNMEIDRNCTIINWPASNPLGTNFNFFTQPGQTDVRYLVIFNNVVHTGNMSCNATHEHKIWFTNGSSSKIKSGCQNLLIPVEKIDKQNPAGTTTAAIGVPFTYTLTIPVLFDPGTDTVINTQGSVNRLHTVVVTDDLNATGADLTYVGHTVTWLPGGTQSGPVPHSFTNVGGLLTWDFGVLEIPPNDQFVIDLTVVLDNTIANVPGSQFINTAQWSFGRLIDGDFFEPLPGENGVTDPLTIAAPDLVMTKSGPATLGLSLNLGEIGDFSLDLQNTGLTDAWDVTIVDQLPDGATGGMCDLTPTITNAQVFESDGTTPVSAPLVQGVDYSFAYAGAPTCEMTLTMLSAAAVIGAGERLIIDYQTKLDPDSQEGAVLTNVAGATQWFNGDPSNPDRVVFDRTFDPTDPGTPAIADHEDVHTVTVDLSGYFFEKSVGNVSSGVSPANTAAPGDTLRYTLRLQATELQLDDLTVEDDLGDLNAALAFQPGSLSVVSIPAGSTDFTNPNGGANGEGILDVRNIDVPAGGEVEIVFDIVVDGSVVDGTIVQNQADLISTGSQIADSDDPNINGQADPDVVGDEDPTQILIAELPIGPLVKAETQATATIGEAFTYEITFPATPYANDIFDVRVTDDLTASGADLRFLSVTETSGTVPWTPINTGTDTNLVIEGTGGGIDIAAGDQITLVVTVVLEDTPTNVAGLVFTNTASFTFNTVDGDGGSERPGDPAASGPMTVVEPDLTMTKSGPPQMTLGIPETFILDVQNAGDSPAYEVILSDQLPDDVVDGGMCDAAPSVLTARVFQSNGTTPVSGALTEGVDFTTAFSGRPGCVWTLTFTSAQTVIGVGERLIVTYETQIDADTLNMVALTNVGGATEWKSTDGGNPPTATDRRTYTEVLTNGTPLVLDHEDPHAVGVELPAYLFEKTVHDPISGTPITTAAPGDTVRYRLTLQNVGDPDFIDLDFTDELDALNTPPAFVAGTLNVVTLPGGGTDASDPNGGAQGTGLLDIRDLTLNTGAPPLVIEFDITLATTLVDGTVVTNQSQLALNGALFDQSDDPTVNGQADPFVDGDEDPTTLTIVVPPVGVLEKDITQATATIGEAFSYRITVPATPFPFPIYDVQITDDLTATGVDLRFLGVTETSGTVSWTPTNVGTDTNLIIQGTPGGIDIAAGDQVELLITVVLEDTSGNSDGTVFTNTADYTYNFADDDSTSELEGDEGTSPPMTIVEPNLTMTKSGPATMVIATPGLFTLDVQNTGDTPAYQVTLSDRFPDGASGGMCDVPPTLLTAQVFQSNGTTPVSAPLVAGVDFSTVFAPAPTCLWTLNFTSAQTAIGPDERLILTYETELDVDTQPSTALINVAGGTRWFSTDGSDPQTVGDRHTYIEVLTNGTPLTLDHEDNHVVNTGLPDYFFEKTAHDPTTGATITTAAPGDTIRYRLRLENTGGTTLSNLGITDEIDALNTPAVFAPGSFALVTAPATADTSGTAPGGGANGTGIIDVRDMTAMPGDVLIVEFDVRLLPVLTNGTTATNQAQLLVNDLPFEDSDDPNVNGQASSSVPDDEDPTVVTIVSAPDFLIQKTSAYITGDPTVLMAGETLRYTITVKNVGTADATDAMLRDAIPANTTYVAGSTTLNGNPVPDGAGGISPLATGILINAPENLTPGAMRADTDALANNVATIVFDVVVDPNVIDGTVISNQAFVSSPTENVFDQPSDDPDTSTPDDPTQDVVGNVPLLFAPKSVELLIDNDVIGQVDPGDRLRYTIVVFNNSATPATGVTLLDTAPNNTTYVSGSMTLDAIAVPDGGGFPLDPMFGGPLPISSSDLTPPLPGPGAGVLTPGESAVVVFDVDVDLGTASGTIIDNQAVVATNETPDVLTDGDGDPGTGPEPTQVVVGDGQRLAITKTVLVVGGGPALADSTLEYLVRVTNIATVPASGVVITDPVPAGLTYVPGSATMNGATTGVTFVDPLITADYSTTNGPLPAGGVITLRFRAVIDAVPDPLGTTITNTATVTWNVTESDDASVSLVVGGTPGVGVLSGQAWHDADFDDAFSGETVLQGWTVQLLRNGTPIQTQIIDTNGNYAFGAIPPNDVSGDTYAVRFSAPGAGGSTASLGTTTSPFTNGPQIITDILLSGGSVFTDLNLPIDPNGVVYGSVSRSPVAGAIVSLLDPVGGSPVDSSCFADPNQQGQVTLGSGHYKFDLTISPTCPAGDYLISVTLPASNSDLTAGISQVIPPESDGTTPAYSVPVCPDDTIPATATYCEIQPQPTLPAGAAGTAATAYHLHLNLDGSAGAGSSQIFNNHIPLDPVLGSAVAITKTTPQKNVSRGQLVPYEIAFSNTTGSDIDDLTIVDRFPAGFTYIEGSARVDDGTTVEPFEPVRAGNVLTFTDVGADALAQKKILLILAVGAGVTEGEFTNRAQAISSSTGFGYSGEAQATVRVVPDPTFDCTDVLGKVFDDANRNGTQDDGEDGLAGVRVATARGLVATTDPHGRFHITCAVVPREDRGSNFVLKLDDRTLPSGYRMTTRQTQVHRATRGKALRFQFGAAIHRVIGLDLADAVFEPDTAEMRMQWEPRIDLLIAELEKKPALLRLSYVADVEDASLVERRMRIVKQRIVDAWEETGGEPLEIETEIFWRRGSPPAKGGDWKSMLPSVDAGPPLPSVDAGPPLPSVDAGPPLPSVDAGPPLPSVDAGPPLPSVDAGPPLPSVDAGPPLPSVDAGPPGEAVERHLPIDEPSTQWTQDPSVYETEAGDRLEEREVVTREANTIKLRGVVPPIYFESGVADIPQSTLRELRKVLDGMTHLENVRLHLVGHADDQALSPALARVYGDNEGLSRERAGEVAEFLQRGLALPPESISFAWAGDTDPIGSNATAAGRARNRRVEVEVWYDEYEDKTGVQEFVVAEEIKRIKVCRTETVCKLTFVNGHARRSRLKNLIPPLRYGEEGVAISDAYVRQVQEALHNLRDKQNVIVKFIGYSDDAAMPERVERIYGNHLALSKARARRASLAIQDALNLPTAAIDSDGRGADSPVATNETDRGRALNRRIEVEFWHDDPLRELPDEPQLCPEDAGAEVVTKVYDPPWGRIAPLAVNGGQIEIPDGYEETLRRAMSDIAGETNVRLRFVGYTANERLDRRTALVYGDDIGLSAARARRARDQIAGQLDLSEKQAEHEGRGYVHSKDVVNGGFLQGDESKVEVQVVYDELAVLDDYEGVDIQRITRELKAKDPLALNLMRITVDGVPIDDPGRSLADIQRCTDVALEDTDIQFRFDNLDSEPRLSVTAQPIEKGPDSSAPHAFRFRTYSNYGHFFDRSEVRIFEKGASVDSDPSAVAEVDAEGFAEWHPDAARFDAPVHEMTFVLRAYDADGQFDETAPQTLWLSRGPDTAVVADFLAPETSGDPLLDGYGEGGPIDRNIRLGNLGTAQVHGTGVPPEHTVWVAGNPVPVDADGNFAAEVLLPTGMHTVEVAVLDEAGNGELFLRDLEFQRSDWFYVGIADVTVSTDLSGDTEDALEGANHPKDLDSKTDGRLAFYVNGKFAEGWSLVASADTREEPVEDLFSNFMDKSPDALFRRIDPDYHYPTFGDDGIVEEMAPTQGKFYARLQKDESFGQWGNFEIAYLENELAQVDRGLYGGNLHYQTQATTSYGEQRLVLDGFAADPGTVGGRDEFRGTGGSLYYLRRQDLLTGSERLRIEIRDKVSNLVTAVVHLQPTVDYDIDYLQGRILLTEPMASTVADQLLVRSEGLSGNEAWLVAQYEYTPGIEDLDVWATGGQGHAWLTDWMKVGLTANRNEDEDSDADSELYAADVTLRATTHSWVKVQAGRSDGLVSTSLRSDDGGFLFQNTGAPGLLVDAEADAYRADASFGFADLLPILDGSLSVYAQTLEAGYTAPGQTTLTDTDQFGGALDIPITARLSLAAKADQRTEDDGLEVGAQEIDLAYQLTEQWSLAAGVRNDERQDDSPIVPLTQEEGDRTDAVVQVGFDAGTQWDAYAFGQGTLRTTEDRDDNHRGGVGGSYRLSDRISLDGEVSHGNLGPAARVGTTFQQSEQTKRYVSYALDNERGYDGVHRRQGNLVSGVKHRMSDSSSVYLEDRYQHGDASRGLARAMGVDLAPSERWTLSANWELGTLIDGRTHAETDRRAGGVRVAYGFEDLHISSGVEYRFDDTEQTNGVWTDRTTWLFRNSLRYQVTPSGRIIGKLNHSMSDSSQGEFFDGGYTEGILGYAFRPVEHDKLHTLVKYTYFYNMPTTDQIGGGGSSAQFVQKSHIAAVDATYDITSYFSIGGKYAFRRSQVSLDRTDPDFFDNDAHLYIVRGDWRFRKNWEGTVEGRMLHLPDLDERRAGSLFTIYRYLGDNLKVGVGYNFTDFSEDLTDLSYDHHGVFFNLVGTL